MSIFFGAPRKRDRRLAPLRFEEDGTDTISILEETAHDTCAKPAKQTTASTQEKSFIRYLSAILRFPFTGGLALHLKTSVKSVTLALWRRQIVL